MTENERRRLEESGRSCECIRDIRVDSECAMVTGDALSSGELLARTVLLIPCLRGRVFGCLPSPLIRNSVLFALSLVSIASLFFDFRATPVALSPPWTEHTVSSPCKQETGYFLKILLRINQTTNKTEHGKQYNCLRLEEIGINGHFSPGTWCLVRERE